MNSTIASRDGRDLGHSLDYYDVANVLLGVILFYAPWILDFPRSAAWVNAYICAVLIIAISADALTSPAVLNQLLNLVIGLWILVAPWALGFDNYIETSVHVVIGAAVAVLSSIKLWTMLQRPAQQSSDVRESFQASISGTKKGQ